MTDPLVTPQQRQKRINYWLYEWPGLITPFEAEQTADSEIIDIYLEAIGDLCHSADATKYEGLVAMLSDIHATLQSHLS